MSMNIDLIPYLIRHHNPENLPASFQMFPDGTARIVVFPEPAKPGTVLATWDRFTKLEQAMAEVDDLPWPDPSAWQLKLRGLRHGDECDIPGPEGQEPEGLEWMKE